MVCTPDVTIVGARARNANPLWGAVFTFRRSGATWNQVDMFLPDPGPSLAWLGTSVDIDGNYVVAGAPFEEVFSAKTLALLQTGELLEISAEGLRLTAAGRQRLDAVLARLLASSTAS